MRIYAGKIKEDLVSFLEKEGINFDKEKKDKLIEYFKNKDENYYLNIKDKIEKIKTLYSTDTELLYILTIAKDKLLDFYNIEIFDPSISREELQKMLISPLTVEILNSKIERLPREIDVLKVEDKYFIHPNNNDYYLYNTKGNLILMKDFEKELKEKNIKEKVVASLEKLKK